MKKLLLVVVTVIASVTMYGQAASQLNFGLVGVSYDIPVATDIAVSPFAGTDFDFNYLTLGVKGSYYFDNILNILPAFDFYAGLNAGYALGLDNNGSDFDFGGQVGGRWFWNDKWGIYLELAGGKVGGAGGGLGLTMKL